MSHAMEFLDKIRKELRFLLECAECVSWIAMGRRDDPVKHDGIPDYNGCNYNNKCGRE